MHSSLSVAAASGKSMGNCMATGHATGVAAAMCVKKRITPREINVRELQDALRADGVNFEMVDRDQKDLRD